MWESPHLPGRSSCLLEKGYLFLLDSYVALGPPPTDLPCAATCFKELVGSSVRYEAERTDIRPYAKDLMSWPEIGSTKVNLVAELRPADSHRLANWDSVLLRDDTERQRLLEASGPATPHCEPTLFAILVYTLFFKNVCMFAG